jgi:hypothetical protein
VPVWVYSDAAPADRAASSRPNPNAIFTVFIGASTISPWGLVAPYYTIPPDQSEFVPIAQARRFLRKTMEVD